MIGLVGLLGEQQVARRMAGPAMAESRDQVSAAIPFRRLGQIDAEAPGFEVQGIPQHHRPAHREQQAVLGRSVAHRRHRTKIGVDRHDFGVADFRKRRVGKGREQMGPVACDAALHGTAQLRCGPRANARLHIRGDVGRVKGAQRCIKRHAARERRPARAGVAAHAIARRGQISALLRGRRHLGGRAADRPRRTRRLGEQRERAQEANQEPRALARPPAG